MSGIHFPITGDNTSFINAMNGVRKEIDSTTDIVKQSGGDIDRVISKLSTGLASLGVAFSAQQLVSQVIKVRGEFQQLEVAFKTMLGSAEKADALLSQLTKTAAVTPFGLQDVASGAKQLLAYGISAENVNDTLVRLGDIAAGLSIPLGDLVYLYGTTMTQGRMFTMDLRQFMGRGIPIAEELANIFGVAKDEVAGLVTAGKVTSDVFAQAIENMTNSGSKFGGLMEAQSKTITGQISNIQDAIDVMLNEIGKSNEGIINAGLQATSKLVENWRTVIDVIGEAVVAYGAYRAVLMTATAYKGVEANASADIEIAGLTELLAVKEKNNNADLQEAVNAGTLSKVKAEKVAELRKELKAQLEVLNSKKAIALAEEAEALKSLEFAQQKKATADQELESVMTYWENASKISEAKADELYLDKIQTAQLNANSAATQLNTAQKNYNTASSNAKAASTAADTLQTKMNTVANNANAVSMNFMKAAGVQLTGMFKALKTAIMSNPLGMIATVITAVGYGMYKLITYETEAEKSQKRLNETFSKAEGEIAKEITKLDRLKGKMSALKEGSKEYEGAKKELIALASSYDAELGKEIEKVGLTEQAYNKLTLAIKKTILERAKASRQNEIDQEYADSFSKSSEKLIKKLTKKLGDEQGAKVYQTIINKAMQGALGFQRDEKGKMRLSTEIKKNGKIYRDEELVWLKNTLEENFSDEWFTKDVNDLLEDLVDAEKKRKRDTKQNELMFGFATESTKAQATGGGNEPTKKQNKAYWEEQKKKAEEELNALSVEELNTETALKIKKRIAEAEAQIAKYDTKKNEGVEKLNEKKKDIISTLLESIDKGKIEVLEEGYDKTIAVIDNAYDKAIEEIDEKAEELKKINKEKGLGEILTPEEQAVVDQAKSVAKAKRDNDVSNIYKELADKYKSFDQRRRDIDEKYQEDMVVYTEELNRLLSKGLDTSDLEASMEQRTKVYNEEISSLNDEIVSQMQTTELWGKLFGDVSKKNIGSLKKIIKETKVLLDYLTGVSTVKPENFTDEQLNALGGNVENIKLVFDQYNNAVEEFDKKTDYPFSSLIKGFGQIVQSAKTAEKAINATGEKKKELEKQSTLEKESGLSYLQKGVGDVAKAFSFATEIVNKFAEAIPNEKLKESAEQLGALSSNISAAAEGAASGGWIGAIVGGVTNLISQTVDAFVQAEVEEEEFLQSTRDFVNEYKLMMLDLKEEDYDSIFGESSIRKVQDAYKLATTALSEYNAAVNKTMDAPEVERKFSSLGATLFSGDFLGAGLGGLHKKVSNETKAALKAYEEGANALQGMVIKTKDYSGFANFFGVEDEYATLKDIAPELWDADGAFNVDTAKKFLDTNKQITQEQRNQIQEVIKTREAYEENISVVEDFLYNAFGSLASELSDIIFDSIRNGTDAWSEFEKVGSEVILSLGKQMMQELIISTMFEKYKQPLIDAWVAENPIEEIGKIYSDMMKDTENAMPMLQQFGEDYLAWMESLGFNVSSSESEDQASRKGFAGMSQETASELNGRFTALQVSGEEIKNQMFNVVFRMDSMLSLATTNNTLLSDIREAHATTNGHLEDIVKMVKTNSEHLISINNSLGKI